MATEPESPGGTSSSLTSVSDVWNERNDQRWLDPSAEPAPSVSRVLYQLYWTIPVSLPPGYRALMKLDDALGRLCRKACFLAWKEEWQFKPLAEWTQHRIHDVGGLTGTESRVAAMHWWRGIVNRVLVTEKPGDLFPRLQIVSAKQTMSAVRELSRGVAMLRGFQMGVSQVRSICDLSFPKPFRIGWDQDRFSVHQMQAHSQAERDRREFAKQAEATWQLAKDALTASARKIALHAKNRFSREGRLPTAEEIREKMRPPDPPPDATNPPRRGFDRAPAVRAPPPSTQAEREPSVFPEDVRYTTGNVQKPDRRGWMSGAHGHYGREVAPRDWWLGNPPLTLEERAHLVSKPTKMGGLGWTIWVCFGCARPCRSCHRRAGQHCAPNCAGRERRCSKNNDNAILKWQPSEECWLWPFQEWPSWDALPAQFWDERRKVFLVPPAFLRDMSDERNLDARRFQPPWVLHIKGGRGPHGTVPCLEHDGRIAAYTAREKVPYCVSQNDLSKGGDEYDRAPPWNGRFNWRGEKFTQDKCLCEGPVDAKTGESMGADLCRNQCQCSYWLCDGWVRDHRGIRVGRCWSAARHRSGGMEIYY